MIRGSKYCFCVWILSNTDPILTTYSTQAKNEQRTSTPITGSEKKKIKIILSMISNVVVLGIETGDIKCNKYLHWQIESISQHMLSYLFFK